MPACARWFASSASERVPDAGDAPVDGVVRGGRAAVVAGPGDRVGELVRGVEDRVPADVPVVRRQRRLDVADRQVRPGDDGPHLGEHRPEVVAPAAALGEGAVRDGLVDQQVTRRDEGERVRGVRLRRTARRGCRTTGTPTRRPRRYGGGGGDGVARGRRRARRERDGGEGDDCRGATPSAVHGSRMPETSPRLTAGAPGPAGVRQPTHCPWVKATTPAAASGTASVRYAACTQRYRAAATARRIHSGHHTSVARATDA